MSEFSPVQQGVLPLVVPVAWLMGLGMYRIGKRSFNGKETEQDRWGIWYWAMAGAVCGKWLFHAVPNATLHTIVGEEEYPSYGIMSFGIFLGLFFMVLVQEIGRIWHGNAWYMSMPYSELQEDMIDRKSVTKNDTLEVDNLNQLGGQYYTTIDKVKDQGRRRWVARILLTCLFFLCAMEGLFTAFWQDQTVGGVWLMVGMSWVLRLLDSLIVYGAMIQGMFHTDERTHWCQALTGYGGISVVWCVAMLLSMIPIFMGMPPEEAESIISKWYIADIPLIGKGWDAFRLCCQT